MAGEWRESTVVEIAAPVRNALVGGPFGSNLVSRDYVDAGVPVVRGQNMGGRWVSGEFAFVTDTKADSLDANLARPGDIVFTQRGTLGQVSVVPEGQFDRYLVSQSQMKLTVNRELADPMFVYYVFSTIEQQDYIRRNSIQTGVPHTNLGILRGTPVPLPPLSEQRAIAHILGTLDDKIELNRRMNETLEAMARAIYKSWFVDFLPVRAKMAAKRNDPSLLLPQVEPNTWFVYAIECNDGSLYIGQTEDLRQRWLQHVGGRGADWTKRHPPVKVPYWERQPSREAAVEREKWLKTGFGRKWLKQEIAARTQTGDPVRAKAEGRLPAGRQATPPAARPGIWFVYALECDDDSFYIGHTEDVMRRFDEHASGKGAEWTKRHPPQRIAYWEELPTRDAAIAREKKLKTGSGREWLKAEILKRDVIQNGLPNPPCLPDRQVADLFPDSFEDCELGEIPAGWKVGLLGEIAEHPRRAVQPSEIEASTPYIALEHMPRRCIALYEWGTADGLESNKFEFKKGEILFGKLRPYFHKVGVAPMDGVCSTDIVVVAPRVEKWVGFVLGHVSSKAFVDYTNASSTGTKMPRTSWGEMARYAIVLPPETVAEAFCKLIRPAVDHIIASIHESRTLAALRDALLPKLLSGELRVDTTTLVAE